MSDPNYTDHARFSPSGSKKWMSCPGSMAMESVIPIRVSSYADDGTACHWVAAKCLTEHYPASKWTGKDIPVHGTHEEERFVEFTAEMAEMTQEYVDAVRFQCIGNDYWIEQRVEFSPYIEIPDQFGTVDAAIVVVKDRELQCHDAKFGHRPVEVTDNSQLKIYALGMYDKLSISHDIETIRLFIHQPQVRKGASEWVISVVDLVKWAEEVLKPAAHRVLEADRSHDDLSSPEEFGAWEQKYLNPNPNDQECAFCRAMATCPSAQRKMIETMDASFDVVAETTEPARNFLPPPGPKFDTIMAATAFMEDFIKAARAQMEGHLLNGGESTLFGLELGRQGHRKWEDVDAAERMIREQFRIPIEKAYNMKLISPTQAERLAPQQKPKKRKSKYNPAEVSEPPVIGPRQWVELQKMVVRNPAKPTVRLKSEIKVPFDPKALAPSDDEFDVVSEDDDSIA